MEQVTYSKIGYDIDTQDKILALMLRDDSFLARYRNVLEPKYFDDPLSESIARMTMDYYDERNFEVPTQDTIKAIVCESYAGEDKKAERLLTMLSNVYQANLAGIEQTSARVVEFGRRRRFEALAKTVLEMLDDGQDSVDDMWELIDRERCLSSEDMSHDEMNLGLNLPYAPEIAKLSPLYDESLKIPTCIPSLNGAFRGGIAPREVGVVVGPTGRGKCLRVGTQCVKFSGELVKVEDVKVGDLLMGPDSKPRTVLQLFPGSGRMYKITPVKGEVWYCNDEHILTLFNTSREDTAGGIGPQEVGDIHIQDYLRLSASHKHVLKQFQVEGGVEFPPQEIGPMKVSPYFLGVWLGDGTKDLHSVQVTKPDAEVELACRDEAEKFGLRVSTLHVRGCPRHSIVGTKGAANELLDELRNLMTTGIRVPPQYLRGPRDVRRQVLAGLLDTDGYLHYNGFEIAQKSDLLADDICFLARSLGLKAVRKVKKVNGTPYHRILITGHTDMIPVRIERKRPKPRKQKKNALRTGFKVEVAPDDNYHGFALDDDQRFLLHDFTVTHNSTLLVNFGVSAIKAYKSVLHILVGELELDDMVVRYASCMARYDIEKITNGGAARYKEIIRPLIKEYKPRLYTQRVSSGTSVSAIRSLISRFKFKHGEPPNLVLLDNADCLSSRRRDKESYNELGNVYVELKDLAHDFNLAIWTDSQTTRGATQQETVGLADISDSFKKARTADLVVTLAQRDEDYEEGRCRLRAVKARRAKRLSGAIMCTLDGARMVIEEQVYNDSRNVGDDSPKSKFRKKEREK